MLIKVQSVNLKVRDDLEDLNVDKRIILKRILMKQDGMLWTGVIWLMIEPYVRRL